LPVEDATRKPDDISVSNDTVSTRVNEIAQNVNEQVVDEIKNIPFLCHTNGRIN